MSIILDALRKSERERRLGQIPTLESGASAPAASRRFVRSAVVLVLLALPAGGGYWWWTHRHAPEAGIEADRTPAVTESAPSAASPPHSTGQISTTVPTPARSDDQPRPAASELSAGTPPRTPPLVLNALSWSEDPKRRFAMINQAIVREGQQIPGGVRLHEIARDGVVLEFQGQRFTLRP